MTDKCDRKDATNTANQSADTRLTAYCCRDPGRTLPGRMTKEGQQTVQVTETDHRKIDTGSEPRSPNVST